MLRLFHSIFGTTEPQAAAYPEPIVQMAIERAVDGTDPRLRTLPGYQKKLRPAVLKAIDHAVALVEGLPPGVELCRENYASDPRLAAFFASFDHMRGVLRDDRALSDFLEGAAGRSADRIDALLLTQRVERKVLGMELAGETVRREVAQVAVNFTGHQLLDPAASREETDTLLRRRAFDSLLESALARIAAVREERSELARQRGLLQRKLAVLESGGWGFGSGVVGGNGDIDGLEAQIEEIEEQLDGLGVDAGILAAHLDILVDVLEQAEQQLWSTSVSLILDRMGIKRQTSAPNSIALELQEIQDDRGPSAVALRVNIPRSEFPERGDFLAEAQRLLG